MRAPLPQSQVIHLFPPLANCRLSISPIPSSIANFFFCFCHTAWLVGSLAPEEGVESRLLSVEAQNPKPQDCHELPHLPSSSPLLFFPDLGLFQPELGRLSFNHLWHFSFPEKPSDFQTLEPDRASLLF